MYSLPLYVCVQDLYNKQDLMFCCVFLNLFKNGHIIIAVNRKIGIENKRPDYSFI